jgi:hypothetical protein
MAAGEGQGLGMFVQERVLLMRATNKQRSHHHDISVIGASAAALVMAAGEAQGLGMFVQDRGLLMRATNKQRSQHHDISIWNPSDDSSLQDHIIMT